MLAAGVVEVLARRKDFDRLRSRLDSNSSKQSAGARS